MPIADANRAKVAFLEETVIGTKESGTGQEYRIVSESLTANRAFTRSEELRSDRQTSDTIATGETNEGDLAFEWSFLTHNGFMEGAMFNSLSTALSYSETDCSAVASDNSINDVSGSFPTVVPGQYIRVGGFTGDAANNGVFRVSKAVGEEPTTSKIIFDRKINAADPGLVDDAAGETVTLKGQFMKNGVERHGYTIEKQFLDISQNDVFIGMEVANMNFDVSTGSPLSGSINFLGRSNETSGTKHFTSPTTTNDNPIYNAVNNLGHIFYGDTSFDDGFNNITFTLENNLRPQEQIGSFALAGVGAGTLDLTGSGSAYFTGTGDSDTLYSNFKASTAAELEFAFIDDLGNVTVFTFPAVKIIGVLRAAGGINTDVILDFEFEAVRDATLDAMIQYSSVPI